VTDLVLSTLNARYAHASLGLRYLLANLGPLRDRAQIVEFEVGTDPTEIAARILAVRPRLVAFGVYVWNVAETTKVVAVLKRLEPRLAVVVGGPEVSFETAEQEICRLADFVVAGEADLAFPKLAAAILDGAPPATRRIEAPVPDLAEVLLPYDLYDDQDVAHRVTYVEASRGCPFECEFCLSALDVPVRAFPLEPFLAALDRLLARGARHVKFVDRTFNLNVRVADAILAFFETRMRPGLFLHFEMIPDRLPAPLRERITRFPAGSLQFEVGIQTFDEDVAALISRRQDARATEDNLRFLREHTRVHVHADLIFGLPGESVASMARSFDRLHALEPHEIQVGILKRLRGTPIVRHDAAFAMTWSPHPPYEILKTSLVDFETVQRLKHFARAWDLVANSGNFVETTALLCAGASAFASFLAFADFLVARAGRSHAIALTRLAELVFEHLTAARGLAAADVAPALWRDYQRGGRSDRPPFLRPWIEAAPSPSAAASAPSGLSRQQRHLGTTP
jgi:radical SAM superfamily enzyme YgiQ (UPF0313 family)